MIEIVVSNAHNHDLLFHPAAERVRGEFQPANVSAEDIGKLVRDFPRGIPGQVIQYDPVTNTGRILDSMAGPEHAGTRAAIGKRLAGISDRPAEVEFTAVKEFPNAHAGTWTGWMARAVKSGAAKLVRGKLPESDPSDMRRSFYFAEKNDPKDGIISQLTALLMAKMSPSERKELGAVLAAAK